jgi:hypothetical protein
LLSQGYDVPQNVFLLLFVAFLWFFQLLDTCVNIIELLHHILFMLIIHKHIFRTYIRRNSHWRLVRRSNISYHWDLSQNITLNLKFITCCKFFAMKFDTKFDEEKKT